MQLKIQVVRYVDDHNPGWVECDFVDAENHRHSIVEKVPVIGDYSLGPDTVCPLATAVRCEILEKWQDVRGRDVVRIATLDVESTEGISEFIVPSSHILSAEATIAELEARVRQDQERLKTAPDRSATAIRHGLETLQEWILALKKGQWR